jgi:histone H3/H4
MSESEDDDDSPDPVKRAPLKNYVKQYSDMRASSDAIDELEAQMLFMAEILWREASHRSNERGYKTVQKQDLKETYDQLFAPQTLLMQASSKLENLSDDIEIMAHESPMYKNWESNDE